MVYVSQLMHHFWKQHGMIFHIMTFIFSKGVKNQFKRNIQNFWETCSSIGVGGLYSYYLLRGLGEYS